MPSNEVGNETENDKRDSRSDVQWNVPSLLRSLGIRNETDIRTKGGPKSGEQNWQRESSLRTRE